MSLGPVPFLYCDLYERSDNGLINRYVMLYYELIAKRHSLSCHYKCDYLMNALI